MAASLARAVIVTSVLPLPPTSGGHKRTLRLIEAAERAGAVPHLLTTDVGEPGAAEELRARGWVVEQLTEREASPVARLHQHVERRPSPYLHSLARRLEEIAPGSAFVQVEHTQNAYYWKAIGSTRYVLSLHNVDSQMLSSIARGSRGLTRLRALNRAISMRSVERRAVSRANVVLTVSRRDSRHFERRARRVLEVPNGIDDELFGISAELPDTEDILFFGQLDYAPNEIGLTRFVREGWPRLAAARPLARLLVAGKGASTELLRTLGEHERVTPLGFVPDISRLLEQSRLILVPVWHGAGTRLKVLEALASARPIVATPLGVEEIGFVHERHGLLADGPGELADIAARLLGDEQLSYALAREGRQLAERYRWSRVLEPLEQLYRGWLQDAGRQEESPPARTGLS
jgi:glycosyltransferase involved in cell wall biosynthesis